jgi:3-oxoacyl-[acyl-carrier protein] reductase
MTGNKLEGKVAIVTGAAQGIGRGIAYELAREGASVVASDIDSSIHDVVSDMQSKGYHVISTLTDVSDKKQVEDMIETTIKKFGKLDILVNNAGIYPFSSMENMTEEEWNRVINVNLKSVFICTQAALPELKSQKGSIINLSSIAGSVIGYDSLMHYSASKAGIMGFTRSAALEFSKYGIRVNAIAPGAIETPTAVGSMNDEVRKATIQAIPLKKLGTPQDIGRLVVFLVSNEANYITGQLIVIDGGLTIS